MLSSLTLTWSLNMNGKTYVLQVVFNHSVGVEHFDFEVLRDRRLRFAKFGKDVGMSTAEFGMALLLAAARRVTSGKTRNNQIRKLMRIASSPPPPGGGHSSHDCLGTRVQEENKQNKKRSKGCIFQTHGVVDCFS